MSGIAAVRAWRLEQLGVGALAVDAGAQQVLDSTGAVASALAGAPTWQGVTRTAVGRRVGAYTASGRRLVHMLQAAADAAKQAGSELVPARALLLQLVDSAVLAGFAVTDDGEVSHASPRRQADAAYLGARIRGALATVVDLDESFARRLRQLGGLLSGSGEMIPDPDGGLAPPATVIRKILRMTPEQRRAFWEALSPKESDTLIHGAPHVFGNLDGVPFPARIAANAINIRRALHLEVALGRGDGPRAQELRRMLTPAAGVDGRPVPRTFIAFSNKGAGSFIEQVGDVHPGISGVAVLVPGTGTNLESSTGQRQRALDLARASGAPVFVFADGAFPQVVAPPWHQAHQFGAFDGTAVDADPARKMAPALVSFGRELDAEVTLAAPGSEITYIGHSYGGSVVGTADVLGLRADRIVFASSAGTGALDDELLPRPPGVERYSLTPPGDPIHWAQKFGGSVHGGDPDSTPGIRRLDTGYYSPQGALPGRLVAGASSHSDYLDDPGSTAFENIAAVVSGGQPTSYVERAPDLPELPESSQKQLRDAAAGALGEVLKGAMRDSLKLPGLLGR